MPPNFLLLKLHILLQCCNYKILGKTINTNPVRVDVSTTVALSKLKATMPLTVLCQTQNIQFSFKKSTEIKVVDFSLSSGAKKKKYRNIIWTHDIDIGQKHFLLQTMILYSWTWSKWKHCCTRCIESCSQVCWVTPRYIHTYIHAYIHTHAWVRTGFWMSS